VLRGIRELKEFRVK